MPEYPPNTPEGEDAPPPTPPPNPPQEKDPREKLEIEQAKLEKLAKTNAALKEELTAAEAAEKEIEQALAAYEKARTALESKEGDAKEYLEVKEAMVIAAVGPTKRAAIDALIKESDDDLEERASEVKNLEEKKVKAKEDYEKKAEKVKEAQAKFDEAKNTLASATADVSTFQSLVPKIEGEDPARPATMYFLTQEAKRAIIKKDPAKLLPSVEELRNKLSDSFQALNDARRAAREAKVVWQDATIDLEQARKALLARRATRQERLLKKVAQSN